MIKFLRILVLAMLVVGLMASGVMAGTTKFYTGAGASTTTSAALEAMGIARSITLGGVTTTGGSGPGANNAAVSFVTAQAISSGSLLTVTFANAGLPVTTVYLCQATTDTSVNGTPLYSVVTTANQTVLNFLVGNSVAAGSTMFLTNVAANNPGTGNCQFSNAALTVNLLPTTSAQLATVTWTAFAAGFTNTAIDAANAAQNIANISKQYSSAISVTGSSSIDFINAPGNGSTFSSNSTKATAANVNFAAATALGGGVDGLGSSLTVQGIISLQDSASWQDIANVYVVGASSACTTANNIAINSTPSGVVNLALPVSGANNFAGTNGTTVVSSVCATVNGNAVIQSRTITESGIVGVSGTGAQQQAGTTFANLMTWTPNGYQGIVTYVNGSPTFNTICFISNQSTSSAPVTLAILTAESGASLTALQSVSLGSVASKGTMRVDLNQSVTPYSYASGTETAGTAIALTGIQANDRYTALFNVGAAPTSVTVNCIQADPAGSKRAVPVVVPQSVTTIPYTY